MERLKVIKSGIEKLPEKKPHLDFVLGLLSIPVIISAIIINVNNLQSKNKSVAQLPVPSQTQTGSQSEKQIIILPNEKPSASSSSQATFSCKKEIGPINISFPQEGQMVTDDPVCINIKHDSSNYCSVVWSYRINNSSWSEYGSNSPCLYNIPNGNIKFDLRIQSTVSEDQTSFQRNFIYQSKVAPPTSAPVPSTATDSADLNK
ncbi:MAG: hypothetical protein A2857_01295 [Candidatus Levybacteria bacterium RIFCSPHIGHO2_01_FULL_36_15]|nr:MAG: hypothetical protein A2857_01295 [Candidatus Levybacteria bacterium RIFCSPHIGHO2_01_FULL_36_15]